MSFGGKYLHVYNQILENVKVRVVEVSKMDTEARIKL